MKILRSLALPAAICFILLPLAALRAEGKPGWTDDQKQALAQAQAEKKLVFMDFTGSDWCPACLKMDQDVFARPEFKQYAKERLVLVELDFPDGKPLAPAVKQQNEALRERYKVEGFPTLIVLDGDGKLLKTFEGYQRGGARAFVAELQKLKG